MGAGALGAVGGWLRWLAVAVLAVLMVAMLPAAAGTASPADGGSVPVIVQAEPGALTMAAREVGRLGGRVGRQLRVVNGFSAVLPGLAMGRLAGSPGVRSVTENSSVQLQAAAYAPTTDAGSLYTTTLATGAQAYWKAGWTGKGMDVAVIDTGTAPVPGLATVGKLVNGPDLSFESQAPNLRYLDTYGHGTHMAGIIAGRADAAVAGRYPGDTANFLGMAPDARIVSVKVADAMGAADVSQVIAAIDWVVQNKTTGGLNIRVLNLSFGTNTSHPYTIDPLCHAVEAAWKKGITVVAATGNAGYYMTPGGPGLTSPARDPYVLSVGATDTNKTLATGDDRVASFSSSGVVGTGGTKTPDLVAPGRSIISLAVPGSFIDQTYGAAGAVTGGFMRGSGTSQAAAVLSGAAALVLQQHPTWTNNQVKALLAGTARPLSVGTLTPAAQGKGTLDLAKALSVTSVAAAYSYPNSSGAGSLGGGPGERPSGRQRGRAPGGAGHLRRRHRHRHPGLQADRRDGLDRGDLERPRVVRVQLQRQQLDGHHLDRVDVVGAPLVQCDLVRADVVGTHVVLGDLDRADVVRQPLVRQHLVQRQLDLDPATPPAGRRANNPPPCRRSRLSPDA